MKIVVDANIARGANFPDRVKEDSNACSALFQLIEEKEYVVLLFDKQLLQEWNTHMSNYADKKFAELKRQRRIQSVEYAANEFSPDGFREIIDNFPDNVISTIKKYEAKKDAHLICLATRGDKIIYSIETNSKEVFCDISKHQLQKRLESLPWVHPSKAGLNWLESNFPQSGRKNFPICSP